MENKVLQVTSRSMPLEVDLLFALIDAVEMVHDMGQLTISEAVVVGLPMPAEDSGLFRT
jgi:hypothetical protein